MNERLFCLAWPLAATKKQMLRSYFDFYLLELNRRRTLTCADKTIFYLRMSAHVSG